MVAIGTIGMTSQGMIVIVMLLVPMVMLVMLGKSEGVKGGLFGRGGGGGGGGGRDADGSGRDDRDEVVHSVITMVARLLLMPVV